MLPPNIALKLDLFVDTNQLYNNSRIPNNVFSLLGMSLKEWLGNLLDSFGVLDKPKILCPVSSKCEISGGVYIDKDCKIEPYSYIKGPAFIGKFSEVRHGAYMRGDTYIGSHCVVGHATEVKESILFDHAKAGHFAYIGNSILGSHVNLGAGTKLANLKLKNNLVRYKDPETGKLNSSGLRKFGAVLGDYSQTGCNSVLSPGSLLMPYSQILPCQHFRGTLIK